MCRIERKIHWPFENRQQWRTEHCLIWSIEAFICVSAHQSQTELNVHPEIGFPWQVFSGVFIQIKVREHQRRMDINHKGQCWVAELPAKLVMAISRYVEFHCILCLSNQAWVTMTDGRTATGQEPSRKSSVLIRHIKCIVWQQRSPVICHSCGVTALCRCGGADYVSSV